MTLSNLGMGDVGWLQSEAFTLGAVRARSSGAKVRSRPGCFGVSDEELR